MITDDALIIVWIPLIVTIAFVQRRRNASLTRMLGLLLLATYVCQLVAVTLLPLPVQREVLAFERQDQFRHNSFVPLKSVSDVLASPLADDRYRQLGGNFLLLAPLTILLPALWRRFRSPRAALMVAVIFPLGIESTQLAISTAYGFTWKIFDVDDLWLNLLGALFGYGVYTMIARTARNRSNLSLSDSWPP